MLHVLSSSSGLTVSTHWWLCAAGLQEVPVCSAEEAMLFLSLGLRHRHVAATRLNYESSRGHAVLSIKLVRLASCVEQPTKALISR